VNASLGGKGDSQRELAESNERIRTYNRASLPCYGLSLAAGLTWAWARFWPESPVTVTARVGDAAAGGAFGLGLGGRF